MQVEGEGGRLPTASTCFNTLRLPAYTSEAALGERLRAALADAGPTPASKHFRLRMVEEG